MKSFDELLIIMSVLWSFLKEWIIILNLIFNSCDCVHLYRIDDTLITADKHKKSEYWNFVSPSSMSFFHKTTVLLAAKTNGSQQENELIVQQKYFNSILLELFVKHSRTLANDFSDPSQVFMTVFMLSLSQVTLMTPWMRKKTCLMMTKRWESSPIYDVNLLGHLLSKTEIRIYISVN